MQDRFQAEATPIYTMERRRSGGTAPEGGGATSQLGLSLTPLSMLVVVDCNYEFPIGLLQ